MGMFSLITDFLGKGNHTSGTSSFWNNPDFQRPARPGDNEGEKEESDSEDEDNHEEATG